MMLSAGHYMLTQHFAIKDLSDQADAGKPAYH
jgi:hypothetical protein